MKPFVRDTLLRQRARPHELDALLAAPDVVDDLQRFRKLSREHAEASADLVTGMRTTESPGSTNASE